MTFGNQNQGETRSSPNDNENRPRIRWIGGGLLLLLGVLLLVNYGGVNRLGAGAKQVPYSQFLEQVEANQVSEAVIADQQIQYELKEAQVDSDQGATRVTVPVENDDTLTQLLREHGVEFSVIPADQGGWLGGLLGWILFPLLFFVLWSFLLRRVQQGGGAPGGPGGANPFNVGQSKARVYSEGKTGISFDDVAGVDEAKAELQEVVDYLRNKEKYTRLGAEVPKGVLLIGPPGTGKTLLGKAVAGEAGVPFFNISGSEFIELFVGVGASRVRDLFEKAKQEAPCIVFIDELDALGKSRGGQGQVAGGGFNEQEQTLNQLLNEMDGFEPNTGVIILGATNRPEVLDPALQRPGRFDRRVVVDRPDKLGRKAILQVHIPKIRKADDVDLDRLAARTSGFAGADLANLVNEAALLAARRGGDEVIMADFNEAIERVIAGLQKKTRVLTDQEKRTVAYHESGHALIGSLVPGAGSVEKISIIPRGVGALGFTLQLPEEDRFLLGEDELRGRMMILLAGRSSEEVVFGKVSTGASDDIQKVTDLAKQYVTQYGMSAELGPIAYERAQGQYLPGMENSRREVSPQVAEAIDRQIKDLVDGAHHMAVKVLDLNRDVLEETAQALLQEEVLEAKVLQEHLSQLKQPEDLQTWLQTGRLTQGSDRIKHALVELDGSASRAHN